MIKLIAADMDGTLLDEHSRLNEEFYEIFEKLKEQNILFAVASGRQYHTLRNNFSPIKDDIAYIAENGSFLEYRGEELLCLTLDMASVREVIRMVRKIEDLEMILCGKRFAYAESTSEGLMAEMDKYYHSSKIVNDLEEVEDDVFKLSVCHLEGEAEKYHQLLHPIWKDSFKVTASGKMWIDFNRQDVNKGIGIRLLQEKYGIKPEETMAFGDYYNDIELLGSAYHSYAMENAPHGVKKAARFMAKSNAENGVLEVLKEKVVSA